jgi:ketosteroid isomerase-like protein
MKKLLNMLMIVFIFSGLNLLAQNDEQMRKNFDKMNDKFGKALMDGDYNTIASFYTDDAISLPSYEPMWRGKDAILEGNKKDVDSGTKYHSFNARTTDFFSSGDITYEIGTYELTFTLPNMTTEMKDHGKYLNVWQKQSDGSWKLKADTWNSDVNPMSMNQAGAKSKDDYNK